MTSRRLLFLVFTAGLALMAALLVHSALKSKEVKIDALRQSTVRILVAARALSPGDTINSEALKLVSWPRDHVPPGALSELQMAIGRIVMTTLSINQPIVASALLEQGKTGGVLPLLIPPGMRAMSIAVDEVSDMAGFVLPHSRVDVLVSIAASGGSNSGSPNELTKIVLQNIEVLAVAQILAGAPDQPHVAKVVTLLVSPIDSERLAAASRLGTLRLAMRNYADQDHLPTPGVSLSSLVGAEAAPAPPPELPVSSGYRAVRSRPRPKGKIVEVIRNGKEHQTLDFLSDGRLRPPPATQAPPAPAPAGPASMPPAP
jgi:pilus assembly protein CpaB